MLEWRLHESHLQECCFAWFGIFVMGARLRPIGVMELQQQACFRP